MKNILLVLIVIFISCNNQTETPTVKATKTSDKQQLIYEILNYTLTDQKSELYKKAKCEKLFYINKTYYSQFWGTKDNCKEFSLKESDIPTDINGVKFQLKTGNDLQIMADEAGEIYYITLGNIDIKKNIATIGIDTNYKSPKDSKIFHMSGGGRTLQFKKINGSWIYEKTIVIWIS
jgi:hypothetical protein